MEDKEKEYFESLAKDFTREELYLILNACGVRALDYQKEMWNSQTNEHAQRCADLVKCYNGLVDKVRFKIDAYENKGRKN